MLNVIFDNRFVLFISMIVNETYLRTQAFVYSNVRKKNEGYRVATECLVKLFLKAHTEQMLFPKANYDLNNPSLHKFELYILYGS